MVSEWERRWPGCRPIGHELRTSAHATWVRFHNLPDSRRYAEEDREYAELLVRQNTVIDELVAESRNAALQVITCAWSGDATPVPREIDLECCAPASSIYWTSIEQDAGQWTHLYAGSLPWRIGVLDDLLRLVADDRTADVIIAGTDLAWLYHPYDGGADVIAASAAQRDRLKAAHRTWLSSHPRGL
jgi:hypothetical protein